MKKLMKGSFIHSFIRVKVTIHPGLCHGGSGERRNAP